MRPATGKISVKVKNSPSSDADIADIARISFSRKASEFTDEANAKLLKYLAVNGHWSPFGHAYVHFSVDVRPEALLSIYTELGSQGLCVSPISLSWFKRVSHRHYAVSASLWKLKDIITFCERSESNTSSYEGSQFRRALEGARRIFPHSAEEMSKTRPEPDLDNNPVFSKFSDLVDSFGDIQEVYRKDLQDKHSIFSVECYAPMFVARQLGKHQVELCWNEESRRYVFTPPELYNFEDLREKPAGSIKQGSGKGLDKSNPLYEMLNVESSTNVLEGYNYVLDCGVAPEQARALLDQRMMISWVWTGTERALKRILDQRIYHNAQKETQEFAIQLRDELARFKGELNGN
jgi:thymidylate synthase ThyX